MNTSGQKLPISKNRQKVDISPVLGDWIECEISMLTSLLNAINKWEEIARSEFSTFEGEYKKKNPKGCSGYVDPLTEEAFIISRTELDLYGSLSVNIAALVENALKSICDIKKDTLKNKSGFADYLDFLGFDKPELKRKEIKNYRKHLFVRELANRFKHSGGKTTKEFIKDHGKHFELIKIDEDIEYDTLPWDEYIKEAKEFLLDIVNCGVIDAEKFLAQS